MGNVEILLQTQSGAIAYQEMALADFENEKFNLMESVKGYAGTLKAFLNGQDLILNYPSQMMPKANDKPLNVILDTGDKKQGFEMYESEFRLISESWRKKKWGFSAVDMFGNCIVREEYDYISGLIDMGAKIYADNRRVYNISNEIEYTPKKGIFKEMFEGIKKDLGRLLSFQKKNRQ